MKTNTIYEAPSMRFCDLELEGFLCRSGFDTQTDQWGSEDGGIIDMDDDVITAP